MSKSKRYIPYAERQARKSAKNSTKGCRPRVLPESVKTQLPSSVFVDESRPKTNRYRYPSRHESAKIAYTPGACFLLFSGLYSKADKEYLHKYIDACFAYNQAPSWVAVHPSSSAKKDIRYHHLFPKSLVPALANSPTNLIELSTIDHFDVHVLLLLAFRSYYHHPDRVKATLFNYIARGVSGCLGQLPKRKQQSCRQYYSDLFYNLTGHRLGSDNREDLQQNWREYQSLRRSTPDGLAYDRLKSYLRSLVHHKYAGKFLFGSATTIPQRAKAVLELPVYRNVLQANEVEKLQQLYDNYAKAVSEM